MLWQRSCGDIITTHPFSKPYKPKNESYKFQRRSEISPSCQQGLHIFQIDYLQPMGKMTFQEINTFPVKISLSSFAYKLQRHNTTFWHCEIRGLQYPYLPAGLQLHLQACKNDNSHIVFLWALSEDSILPFPISLTSLQNMKSTKHRIEMP